MDRLGLRVIVGQCHQIIDACISFLARCPKWTMRHTPFLPIPPGTFHHLSVDDLARFLGRMAAQDGGSFHPHRRAVLCGQFVLRQTCAACETVVTKAIAHMTQDLRHGHALHHTQ